MNIDLQSRVYGSGLLVIAVGIVAAVFFVGVWPFLQDQPELFPVGSTGPDKIRTFESDEAFQTYLVEAQATSGGANMMMARSFAVSEMAVPTMAMDASNGDDFGVAFASKAESGEGFGGGVDRVSETNVQVAGIDEPDIVKTNGSEIFVSTPQYGYPVFFRGGGGVPEPAFDIDVMVEDIEAFEDEAFEKRIAPGFIPPQPKGGVHTVKAFPPAELALSSTIDMNGDLLLVNNTLLVFTYNKVVAYDIEDPTDPKEVWEKQLDEQQSIVSSRLMDDTVYLVTARYAGYGQPCPIPLMAGEEATTISCTSIYRPDTVIPVDSTYTVMAFNAESGDVENTLSFVGSRNNTTVYMSHESMYVVYQKQTDMLPFTVGFLQEKGAGIVPDALIKKISRLQTYDIGRNAKMTEMQEQWNRYMQTLDRDERLRVENELANRIGDYYESHKRELASSGIMKVAIDNLTLDATGAVPGRLLNQFSLDEYDGHLRVATTIDQQWFGLSGIGRAGESVNDIYVFDEDLDVVGSVQDLGRDERIFSARFVGDRGYLVTFKQIDPFFVLDLSDHKNPTVEGELKIPGFSSYLHPVDEHQVLGVGREGSQVKATLFNVADPKNPIEQSTYQLKEHWSDVQNTHHAFLLDSEFNVFFIPGGNAGYIFGYDNNEITLKKAVSNIRAKRALFINNYLYVVGEDKIVILNEQDWERVNELNLN